MPNVFIVAGPNGVGKTTYARRFLPQEMHCWAFVNADLIAAALSPFAVERASFEAGRIMLRRLRACAAAGGDFSFETTLSGRAYASLLREWRRSGYRIWLDFIWVPDFKITRARVRQRVSKGGHDIPDAVQRRRFYLGLRNLAELYRPLVDGWRLFDNTETRPQLVAEEREGVLTVADADRLAAIERAAKIRLMPGPQEPQLEESEAMTPDEMSRRARRAMRKAFADVVLENKAWGLPVIQGRAGRGVVEVPTEQLERWARRILEVNGEPLPEAEEEGLLAQVGEVRVTA